VVIAGQGAEIDPGNIAAGTWISASKLYEGGVKGSFLDDKLYAAISVYKQERTDYSSQSITVNQAVETSGMEAEFRWSVNDHLLVTGGYTRTSVFNLTGQHDGTMFSFFGAEDMKQINPALTYGGQPIGLLITPTEESTRRAGIPKNIYSLTATYEFMNGFALSGSLVSVDSVFSGQSQSVRLPAYTLVDVGASYKTGKWLFRANIKNLTNETYFRANFTELFGSTIALPEKPRSFQASVIAKF
jgi:iron complex outermembrane receptor protein